MEVYVLMVDGECVGVFYEHTKAYDVGCRDYNGDFDIDEHEIQCEKRINMEVFVLMVAGECVGVFDEYTKAYDIGCRDYNGDFDIDEHEVQ